VDEQVWLAERFETHRGRMKAVASRMLGSSTEADDAVQGAWFRFSRSDTSSVENLGAWLTTVISRVCLNILQARRTRPVAAIEPDFPERRTARSQTPTRSRRPFSPTQSVWR
jgi:RNA polymerase sigma-70 factor, ECF subfamily